MLPPLDEAEAFSFTSPHGLVAMKRLLDAGTAWAWREGDSAYFDYLAARTEEGRVLRLYPERGRFVIHVRRGSMDAASRALVLDRLLPLIEASDIRPDEALD